MNIEEILDPWNLGIIQEYLNIRDKLKKYNKTDNDVREFVAKSKNNNKDKYRFLKENSKKNKSYLPTDINKYEKCPTRECRGLLVPGSGNFHGGESIFLCKRCGYSKYDGRNIGEIILEINNKTKNK